MIMDKDMGDRRLNLTLRIRQNCRSVWQPAVPCCLIQGIWYKLPNCLRIVNSSQKCRHLTHQGLTII